MELYEAVYKKTAVNLNRNILLLSQLRNKRY